MARAGSEQRITGAANTARSSLVGGAQPGAGILFLLRSAAASFSIPNPLPLFSLSLAHVLTTKLDIESAASVRPLRISPFLSPSTSRRRTGTIMATIDRPTDRPTDPTDHPKRRESDVLLTLLPRQVKSCSSAIVIVAARVTLSSPVPPSAVRRNSPILISRAREIVGVLYQARKFSAVHPVAEERATSKARKKSDGRGWWPHRVLETTSSQLAPSLSKKPAFAKPLLSPQPSNTMNDLHARLGMKARPVSRREERRMRRRPSSSRLARDCFTHFHIPIKAV